MVFGLILFIIIIYVIQSCQDAASGLKTISDTNAIKKTSEFLSCERIGLDQILTLKVRSPQNRNVLKIEAAYTYHTSYKPKQLVYTGATVGGITTGGFHEEGGYNYISGKEATGKFNIYHLSDGVYPVKKIRLTDELYEEAKSSLISRYLNKNKEIIVITEPHFSEIDRKVIENATSRGDSKAAEYIATQKIVDGYPTRKKCEEILRWICGEPSPARQNKVLSGEHLEPAPKVSTSQYSQVKLEVLAENRAIAQNKLDKSNLTESQRKKLEEKIKSIDVEIKKLTKGKGKKSSSPKN